MPTVSSDIDNFLSAANNAAARSALGVSTISTPSIYYVQTTGNNATAESGNPAKPYATVAAAVAAGESSAQPYTVNLGAGSFVVTGLSFSGYRVGFTGVGPQTVLEAQNSSSGEGFAPTSFDEKVVNLTVSVYTNGYTALGEFETALDAAPVTITGFGWVGNISARGGAAFPSSGGNAGDGQTITLQGSFICIGTISAEESANGYGSFGNAGNFIGDGCDLRTAVVNVNGFNGSITIGRCSYISGFGSGFSGTLNDKGGNALW